MARYVHTGDAARALNISTATLTRWAAKGIATPAQTTAGGHFRWDLASLRAQVERYRLGGHDVTAEDIARVVHAANRELQITQGDPVPSPPWDEAPDYQAREATAGVQEVLRNRELTAEQSHEMWMMRMRADGWIYGTLKTGSRRRTRHCCRLASCQQSSNLKTNCSSLLSVHWRPLASHLLRCPVPGQLPAPARWRGCPAMAA